MWGAKRKGYTINHTCIFQAQKLLGSFLIASGARLCSNQTSSWKALGFSKDQELPTHIMSKCPNEFPEGGLCIKIETERERERERYTSWPHGTSTNFIQFHQISTIACQLFIAPEACFMNCCKQDAHSGCTLATCVGASSSGTSNFIKKFVL